MLDMAPFTAFRVTGRAGSAQKQAEDTGREGYGDMLMEARGQARLEAGELRSAGVEAEHVEIRPN